MKRIFKRIFYPKKITQKMFIFFTLALFPVVLFSLLHSGIDAYGNRRTSDMKTNTVYETMDTQNSTSSYENFNIFFNNSKEASQRVFGSSYVNSEFIIGAKAWVKPLPEDANRHASLFFLQSENLKDQFFNYNFGQSASFTKYTSETKAGIYVAKGYLEEKKIGAGSRMYFKDKPGYTLEILGFFESAGIDESTFLIVGINPSEIDYIAFHMFSVSLLHTLNKSISLKDTIELSAKINNEIVTRAYYKDTIIGHFQKVLKIGEVFAIVTSIVISGLLFYSILGRGSKISNINHIQYLYYKDKKKLAWNFLLENMFIFTLSVFTCLFISSIIVLIAYLKFDLVFFITILPITAIIVDGILVIIASLASYWFTLKQRKALGNS